MSGGQKRIRCACEVFVLPRSGNYDTSVFNTAGTPTVASTLFQQGDGTSFYLGDTTLHGPSSAVMQCGWSKTTEEPAGVFQMQVKPKPNGQQWGELVNVGDLLFIFMDNARRYDDSAVFGGKLITLGIVDRVNTVVSLGENHAPMTMTAISGRDFGKILQDTSTVFDPAFAYIEQTLFGSEYVNRLGNRGLSAQSPMENIITLLDLIYNHNATGSKLVQAQWRLGTSRDVSMMSLLNTTLFVQKVMPGYTLATSPGVAQAGNVWTLLESYANRCLNEFYIDVCDYGPSERSLYAHLADTATGFVNAADAAKQQATWAAARRDAFVLDPSEDAIEEEQQILSLVLRQRPYDYDAFNKLRRNFMLRSEVHEDNTGYSGHSISNFFRVRTPMLSAAYTEAITGVKINKESIMRYGVRRFEPETRYIFGSSQAAAAYNENQTQDFSQMLGFYADLVSTWFAANDRLREGMISSDFRPDIRVGTQLRIADDKANGKVTDYYVQALNHNYSAQPGASRSTFTLVRGINPANSDRLENNLKWSASGSSIPASLDPFKIYSVDALAPNSVGA